MKITENAIGDIPNDILQVSMGQKYALTCNISLAYDQMGMKWSWTGNSQHLPAGYGLTHVFEMLGNRWETSQHTLEFTVHVDMDKSNITCEAWNLTPMASYMRAEPHIISLKVNPGIFLPFTHDYFSLCCVAYYFRTGTIHI